MTTPSTTNGTTNSPVPGAADLPDLERHARKCGICHHPNREEIEEGFLSWRPAEALARTFNVRGGRDAIYRHAHALDLFEARRKNMREAVELIIEFAALSQPKARDVLDAVRLHARISAQGELAEMAPSQHILITRRADQPNSPGELQDAAEADTQFARPGPQSVAPANQASSAKVG